MGFYQYIVFLVVYVLIDYLLLLGTHHTGWYYSPIVYVWMNDGTNRSLTDYLFRKESLLQAIPLFLAWGIVFYPLYALVIFGVFQLVSLLSRRRY